MRRLLSVLWFPVNYLADLTSVFAHLFREIVDGIAIRFAPEDDPRSPQELIDVAAEAVWRLMRQRRFRRDRRGRLFETSVIVINR